MRHLGYWLSFVVVLGWSAISAAQEAPDACKVTPDAQTQYNTGWALGGSWVRAAWNRNPECSDANLAKVGAAVNSLLTIYAPKPSQTSLKVICRFAGEYDGILAQLDNVFALCSDTCAREGQIVGDIAAQAYCTLSILLDGLADADEFIRGPVEICGLSFEVGCDANFLSKSVGFPGCAKYTRDPFLKVYQQTQINQCAYDPILPDDPDP